MFIQLSDFFWHWKQKYRVKSGETSDLFLIQHSGDETGKKLYTVTDNSVSLAY